MTVRNLVIVLGDQLDLNSAAFHEFDSSQDLILMAEVLQESTHVWSHKSRIVLFLSAMRHFREELKMSNYCQSCIYNPDLSTGEKACPFTTLYWDFLIRHQDKLKNNNRMALQLKNLKRLTAENQEKIQSQARHFREKLTAQRPSL